VVRWVERKVLQLGRAASDPNWSDLIASMDKMHMAMGAVKLSGKYFGDDRMVPDRQRNIV